MPIAVLVLSGGIGDIIRGSSLVGVLTRLGYEVDLVLMPGYPEVRTLYEGAPQIRRIFTLPFGVHGTAPDQGEEIARQRYDLAICKIRDKRLQQLIIAQRRIWPSLQFRKLGDAYFCTAVARKLGWDAPLPRTFSLDSGRRFDLPADTVALHPGCNPTSQWKRWHGFADLAGSFPSVAVVGSHHDLIVEQTYYQRPFSWPPHVRDFTGLRLLDTASLLRQCGTMISNDSGLMHLAVAMGTLTFGIFGATRPEKEMMPYAHMHAIRPPGKQCGSNGWLMTDEAKAEGMERLKSLEADELLAIVHGRLAGSSMLQA